VSASGDRRLNRILYVEDDEDIRTVATMALETVGGYTLRVCGSGREAVAAAVDFSPDLILLDVMMPGMDGPTTLEALRRIPGAVRTPVVFMTAKVQPSEIERYKEMGAIAVIAKPFDPMTLAAQVRAILGEASGGHSPA
jgi:two-component system OmpR family response regulator